MDEIDFDNMSDDDADAALEELFPGRSSSNTEAPPEKTAADALREIEALREYAAAQPKARDARKARQAELADEIERLDAALSSDKASVQQRHQLGTERAIRSYELEQLNVERPFAAASDEGLNQRVEALGLAAEDLLAQAKSSRDEGRPRRSALIDAEAANVGKERIALAMEVDRRQLQKANDTRLQSQAETFVAARWRERAAAKLEMDLSDPTLDEYQREVLITESHKPVTTHKGFAAEVSAKKADLAALFVEGMALRVARGLPLDDGKQYAVPASIRDEQVELWQSSKIHRG